MQERHDSSALAMEICLSGTKPSICHMSNKCSPIIHSLAVKFGMSFPIWASKKCKTTNSLVAPSNFTNQKTEKYQLWQQKSKRLPNLVAIKWVTTLVLYLIVYVTA